MHELPWITGDWQITSRVTKDPLFQVTNLLFYFLHAILCPAHNIPLKQSSIAHFAIVGKEDP